MTDPRYRVLSVITGKLPVVKGDVMSCGAWCQYIKDDINGQVIVYCINCGRRGYSDDFESDDYESDPDAEREMMQEAGLL